MASTFSLLTSGGAKFASKYQSDIDLFAAKRSKGKGITKAAKGSRPTADVIPSSLDFFGSNSSAQTKPDLADSEPESSSSGTDTEVEAETPQPRHKITINGPEPLPASVANIDDLLSRSATGNSGYLAQNLGHSGVSSLWGVQCAVAGCYLERRDTLVVAPTGSGKTIAYLLPLFIAMQQPCRARSGPAARGIRSLIVVPTYDLAVQIRDVADSLARGRKWRIMLLSKPTEHAVIEAANGGEDVLGIDMLICTPERLHHLVDEGSVRLASVQHLILDEADRLLSDEFHAQTLPILDGCNNDQLQKCFLSATIPSGVETEAKRYLKDGGTRVVVGVKDAATINISQSLLYTGSESGKMLALRNMISGGGLPYPSLIFVQSIERANELYRSLVLDGLLVDVVHGERSKSKREEAIKSFREGRVWVLVVTDVLARGMDFRGVQVVVNYDFPQTVQSYIHRIGRTGRAGRPGKAVTFFSLEDGPHLRTVANVLRASGCDVPQYMLDMPKPSKNMKKKLRSRPVERKQVGGSSRNLAREDAKRKNDMRAGTSRKPRQRAAAPEVDMDE